VQCSDHSYYYSLPPQHYHSYYYSYYYSYYHSSYCYSYHYRSMSTDAEMLASAAFSSPVKTGASRFERKHAQRKAMAERGDLSQLR
jgi:hypothetical protein